VRRRTALRLTSRESAALNFPLHYTFTDEEDKLLRVSLAYTNLHIFFDPHSIRLQARAPLTPLQCSEPFPNTSSHSQVGSKDTEQEAQKEGRKNKRKGKQADRT